MIPPSAQVNPEQKITTLLYHSISNADADPWGICVSAVHFEEHIQFLTAHFNIITVAEVIMQLTTGHIVRDSICITFDDGYADNYLSAKPILEKYNCPATFFIPTALINGTSPFWWDELEMIFLGSTILPARLSLEINGRTYLYLVEETELTAEQLLLHAGWRWYHKEPTGRCAVFLAIWELLRPLCYEEIKKQLAYIRQWAGLRKTANKHRLPMNEKQLRALSENSLFTIGMHTNTHPDLAAHEKHVQLNEILTCKETLKSYYGINSHCLAYPYGRYNADTIDVVKQLGIEACFTTEAAGLSAFADMATLGRYQVENGGVDTLNDQLKSVAENTNVEKKM